MTKTSPSIPKILHTLRNEKKTQEQTSVLTYLRSNIGKVKLAQTLDEVQYVELCQLLLALVMRTDEDGVDKDTEMKDEDAEMALCSVLEFNNHHVNLFKLLLDTERKKRVKVLQFLNRIELRILARIIQDPTVVDFISDCFHMIQSSFMKWIAANSCKDNIQSLIEAETQIPPHDQENEEQLISHALTMLYRLYEYATIRSPDFNIERIHPLLFDRVITLAYMGHKRQRKPALKLLNQSLNTNLISYIKDKYSNLWGQYKNTLQNTYCTRMSLLVKSGDDDWVNQWCLSIKILGTDLHRGAELINNLLSVEEKAFKSTDMTVRKKAFEAWKHLIDNFALNTAELTTLRRIKLLCIPLNAKNSKIEIVAIAKLETWWHLIVKLYPNLDKSVNQVIEQFLNFCFGPLGDTPLLSKKCDVIASPGKRFSVTKLMAIDTLLQLLIQRPIDRHCIPRFIEDRLPNSVPHTVFQASYKCLLHSVGEAMLLINELDKGELKNRKELNEILWANLMMYIQQSSPEHKTSMYKELILILEEVISHITDSPLIIGLIFDVIVAQFVKITQHLIYDDDTLMDVLLKLLSPGILRSADKKYLSNLTFLICHAIKPQNTKQYHCHTLHFVKAALTKMELLMEHEVNLCVFELWCTFAEIVIKYIEQNQQINEGTAMNHNFEAITLLIIFPIRNIFWCNPGPILKISKLWRELYKQFEMQTDLVATVKPNEILHDVTAKMEKCIMQDKRCYRIIAHCVDTLISSINYEVFLSQDEVPPLIKVLSDVTVFALNDTAVLEIELSLKATSSLLITVYGLNQKCALMYLHILKPSIESMLKVENIENILKEIVNTWETVVIMFRGSTKFLTPEFISSFRISILLALRHNDPMIAAQASSLLDIRTNSNEEIKSLLDEIEEIFQKTSGDKTISTRTSNEGSRKNVKMAGSFLNRKVASPKTLTTLRKDCETKKLRVPSPLPPSESNSQDYVIIKSDVKLDINRLTEHQKESLKRHRDDIPAMYNDLSQSASRNTQQLEDWFKNKSEVPDAGSNNHKNADNVVVTDGEANKENNQSSCMEIIDNNEKLNEWTIEKKVDEDESHVMNQMNLEYDEIPTNDTNTQMSILADDEIDVSNEKVGIETHVRISHITGKKLNFDSHEEFPAENEKAKSTAGCSLRLAVDKSHTPQTIVTETNTKSSLIPCRVESGENTESQSLESLHTKRRGRSRGRPTRTDERSFRSTRLCNSGTDGSDQNLKRKAAFHSESEGFFSHKRQRYSVIPQSSSDTTSDAESINSTEGENNVTTMSDVDIPKRTKKEMSRLQINMVFNSRMPSKLRAKPVDDYVYGNNSRRQKNKSSDRNASQNGSSQELVKHRKPRETRSLSDVKTDTLKTATQAQSLESDGLNAIREANIGIEIDDEDKQRSNNTFCSNVQTEKHKDSDYVEDKKITDACNNPDISNENDPAKNQSSIDNNFDIDRIEDEEEVIESSQKPNSLLRSPHRRNNDETNISFDSSEKSSPEKRILHDDPDAALPNSNLMTQQTETSRNLPHEKTNIPIATGFNFSSPKTIKRLSRTKVFTPQGRAAHMLGLVTKLAIGEKNESSENIKYSEDETSRKLKYPKELEVDGVKKEKTLILKEPERIGSPSGSRQEKIFNNMKSKDFMSSPPSKLFSNLKNDGEKVSPKFEKTILTEFTKTSGKDHDIESGVSLGRDELPLLEWSNANPPSLTASPSVSILKRQRQILSDIDIDTMSSKKKRVSFTDPPVSREMGYEVISELSPIKANKFAQPRSFLQRKDSPNKMKQSRFRTIQIDVEKSYLQSSDKSKAYISSDITKSDHGENEIPTEKANDFGEKANGSDGINHDTYAMNPGDHKTNITSSKNIDSDNSSSAFRMAINTADQIDHGPISDLTTTKGIQQASPTTEQESVLETHHSKIHDHEDENNCNYHALNITEPAESADLQTNHHTNSSKFNISDDPTIARILNGSNDSSKSNDLEDTVDIQNVSNLNSTANSDELFDGKFARTSTQIAAMTAIAQNETLPVTDSMFLSQTTSQDSLATQQSLAMPLPNTMDMTNPICPILLSCDDPIDAIVNDLVNPLWTKNLSKYFAARNINTIGELAQLSEREVARFPVKGSPKATYVKQVLDKFSVSHISQLENQSTQKAVAPTNNAVCSTPRITDKFSRIVNEAPELIPDSNYNDDANNFTTNLTAASLSPVNSSQTDNKIEEQSIGVVDETSPRNVNSIQSNDFGSIILDTSISSPPKNVTVMNPTEKFSASSPAKIEDSSINESIEHGTSTSATNFEAKQMDLEKLLDEIDPNLLLQSAIKRSAPEDIMAQYKIKMKHKSDAEFTNDTLRILGLDMGRETDLKNTCREYGLTKVLGRLPAIFNTDNNFFTKVLHTYRMKINADDCINALDLNQIKKAVCNKCSSSELCDMLSTVLNNEARNDINTPITEVSSLNAMLKRMPMDSIISHTVANDELIPSSFILEIALQNNDSDTITHALDAQFPNIVENIMDRNMSVGRIISHMNKSQLSTDELFKIYRAVCDKLSPTQVLDAHCEVMKEKLGIHDNNDPQ